MSGLLRRKCDVGAKGEEVAHTQTKDGTEDESCATLAKLHDSSRTTATYTTAAARSRQ